MASPRNKQQATPDRPPAPLTISASDGEEIDQGPDSESLPLLHQVDQWISGSQTLEPLGPKVFPFPQLSTMGRTTHDMTCLPGVPSVEEKKIERLSRKDCRPLSLPSPSNPSPPEGVAPAWLLLRRRSRVLSTRLHHGPNRVVGEQTHRKPCARDWVIQAPRWCWCWSWGFTRNARLLVLHPTCMPLHPVLGTDQILVASLRNHVPPRWLCWTTYVAPQNGPRAPSRPPTVCFLCTPAHNIPL